MNGHFVMLSTFVLPSLLVFLCYGVILSPPSGTNFTFLPGETHNVTWTFNDSESDLQIRNWHFTGSSDGSPKTLLAIVLLNRDVQKTSAPILPNYDVYKPSTLRLRNITHSYDGTYEFEFRRKDGIAFIYTVRVFVAIKPNVVIHCSNPLVVNEGDNVSCICRGEGGNPPSNVTWFDKDNNVIGDVGVVSKTLVITNITLNDGGNYRCKAQSYDDTDYRDEKPIKIKVTPTYPPQQTNITISPMSATESQRVTITCESDGYPEPTFIIYYNGTVVRNKKTYIIQFVNISHQGSYRCEAKNKLGNDLSDVKNLTVSRDQQSSSSSLPTMSSSMTVLTSASSAPTDNVGKDGDGGSNIGLIIGIVVGMLFLVAILVVVIFCCYKSKQKNGYRGENGVEPLAGANNPQPNHYEEAGGLRENAYESVGNQYETVNNPSTGDENKPSTSKAPPPVYASIDRENREGNPLYSYLDFKDEPKRKPDKNRPAPTEYASIDMSKLAPVEKKDDKKGGDKEGDEKKE